MNLIVIFIINFIFINLISIFVIIFIYSNFLQHLISTNLKIYTTHFIYLYFYLLILIFNHFNFFYYYHFKMLNFLSTIVNHIFTLIFNLKFT